jgi:hypothetical protein
MDWNEFLKAQSLTPTIEDDASKVDSSVFCSDRTVAWMKSLATWSSQLNAPLCVRFHFLARRHEWEHVGAPIRRSTLHLYALSDHSIVIGVG